MNVEIAREFLRNVGVDPYNLERLDFEPACDFGTCELGRNAELGEHDDPARWILYKRHECGMRFALVCDRCKVTMYDIPSGVITCRHCGAYFRHRDFFLRIEPINRSK